MLATVCQVPGASWSAARVDADLALSKELMLKLDTEKGIEANPLEADAASKGISVLKVLSFTCPSPVMCVVPGNSRQPAHTDTALSADKSGFNGLHLIRAFIV